MLAAANYASPLMHPFRTRDAGCGQSRFTSQSRSVKVRKPGERVKCVVNCSHGDRSRVLSGEACPAKMRVFTGGDAGRGRVPADRVVLASPCAEQRPGRLVTWRPPVRET
ncbi:hypothetical protein SKAU_G00269540 [Synaphobranchus kaupii]|uniref:Uncharacterized protein n=1 Tax=Synaphobranchus kaupii TaxID=118154 RepID=A0A9Q1F078_SYNKA|nr:hypothetical protein SKAU_G00269540 [Synaphobranchus kaupii]